MKRKVYFRETRSQKKQRIQLSRKDEIFNSTHLVHDLILLIQEYEYLSEFLFDSNGSLHLVHWPLNLFGTQDFKNLIYSEIEWYHLSSSSKKAKSEWQNWWLEGNEKLQTININSLCPPTPFLPYVSCI